MEWRIDLQGLDHELLLWFLNESFHPEQSEIKLNDLFTMNREDHPPHFNMHAEGLIFINYFRIGNHKYARLNSPVRPSLGMERMRWDGVEWSERDRYKVFYLN